MKNNLDFNTFCEKILDRLYEPKVSLENQSTGYKLLKTMLEEGIKPASLEEYLRWKNKPTLEEFTTPPPLKYLTFLHENMRPFIRENWDKIKQL